jgi:hypothetical protein
VHPDLPTASRGLARLSEQPSAFFAVEGPAGPRVIAAGDSSRPQFDVTHLLSPVLVGMFAAEGIAWLSPVERSDRLRHREVSTQGVAIASPWRQDSPVVAFSTTQAGTLEVRASAGTAPTASNAESPRFVPGDREGAHALLSAVEGSLFLIGGRRAGEPTREFWRYDLEAQRWQRLLRFSRLAPRDVLAAAYDYNRRRLLVLDEGVDSSVDDPDDDSGEPARRGGKGGAGSPKVPSIRARLVVHDLGAKTSTLLGEWPRVPLFDRLALVARDDGSFVLLASGAAAVTQAWSATATARLDWTGHRVLPGRLVFQPTLMERGMVVPLSSSDGALSIPQLTPEDFFPPQREAKDVVVVEEPPTRPGPPRRRRWEPEAL